MSPKQAGGTGIYRHRPWFTWLRLADLPRLPRHLEVQRPPHPLRVATPRGSELVAHESDGVVAVRREVAARRAPGAEVADRVVQRPVLLHREGRRVYGGEGEMHLGAALDHPAVRRPVGADDLAVE